MGIYRDSAFEEIMESKETCGAKREKALEVLSIPLAAGGHFSEKISTSIKNTLLPKMYFFVVMDCDKNIINSMPKIEVEIDMVTS